MQIAFLGLDDAIQCQPWPLQLMQDSQEEYYDNDASQEGYYGAEDDWAERAG